MQSNLIRLDQIGQASADVGNAKARDAFASWLGLTLNEGNPDVAELQRRLAVLEHLARKGDSDAA